MIFSKFVIFQNGERSRERSHDTNQTSSRLLLAMYALQLFCLCHTLSKYTVFTNALLQAFAPYCRVAIVRVKSTLAAKDDPLGNGEPTVMQGWKIFEMGSELFLRNFGLPSFRSKNKA